MFTTSGWAGREGSGSTPMLWKNNCKKKRLNLPEFVVVFKVMFLWGLCFYFLGLGSRACQHLRDYPQGCQTGSLRELNTVHADGPNCHCAAAMTGSELHWGGP